MIETNLSLEKPYRLRLDRQEKNIAPALRGLCYLSVLVYTGLLPYLDSVDVFLCGFLLLSCVTHVVFKEIKTGSKSIVSLKNALLVGLLFYGIPIFLLFSVVEIPVVLDMERTTLRHAAKLTYMSLAITGIASEMLRKFSSSIHKSFIKRATEEGDQRQYFILAIMLLIYASNFVRAEVFALLGSGNRFALTQEFETGKMWFIQYLATGSTIAFIYQHAARRVNRDRNYYIGLFCVVSFWSIYLALGNRRGILSLVLAGTLCYSARTAKSGRVFVILLVTFGIAGAIGVLRQNDGDLLADQAFLIGITNFFGEFIYPGYTLVETVSQGRQPTFEVTWVSMIYKFIVAQINNEPYLFLAHQFAADATPAGTEVLMGFAYLPITEGYKAFGTVGASLSGLGVFTTVLLLARVCKNFPSVYLILFSLVLDLNRSEFGAMLVQFFIVAIGFQLTRRFKTP